MNFHVLNLSAGVGAGVMIVDTAATSYCTLDGAKLLRRHETYNRRSML
jgi:dihydropteroate synthase